MTRRERLQQRVERRREWAEKRAARASSAFERARKIADNIPLGQPILVGHHSERHARADQRRIESAMGAGVESSKMSAHHESKADGLERQLERTIFSDDVDAVERLEEKARAIDAECDLMKRANAAFRRAKGAPGWAASLKLDDPARFEESVRVSMARCSWERVPFPAYALANARANARRARLRVDEIKSRHIDAVQAELRDGVLVERDGAWCSIVFAEKPSRAILDALKRADFRWRGARWSGKIDRLPATAPTANGIDVALWDSIMRQVHA